MPTESYCLTYSTRFYSLFFDMNRRGAEVVEATAWTAKPHSFPDRSTCSRIYQRDLGVLEFCLIDFEVAGDSLVYLSH